MPGNVFIYNSRRSLPTATVPALPMPFMCRQAVEVVVLYSTLYHDNECSVLLASACMYKIIYRIEFSSEDSVRVRS